MHYLTISEFARLNGVSRQAIQGRIESGSLPLADVKVTVKMIPVEDTVYEKLKRIRLAPRKAKA